MSKNVRENLLQKQLSQDFQIHDSFQKTGMKLKLKVLKTVGNQSSFQTVTVLIQNITELHR